MDPNIVLGIGAVCFGIVIGWITYRTLRRTTDTKISDLAGVLAAVGGAAVTGLFKPGGAEFGWYCIGLFVGFFSYFMIARRSDAPDWMGTPANGSAVYTPVAPPPQPPPRR